MLELINLNRILSEDTLNRMKAEIREYTGTGRYKILWGQVRVGIPREDDDEIMYSIIDLVCSFYKVNRSIVLSKARKQPYMKYRQMIFHLVRKYTQFTTIEIGRGLGGFDHATTLHSVKMTQRLLKDDINFNREYDHIEQKLLLTIRDEDD